MARVIMRVRDEQLQQWFRQQPQREAEILRLFQQEGSLLVMTEMRQKVPIRTGFLRESIATRLTPHGFTVYPTAPYAEAVEKGVGPRTIFPVRAKVLRFETREGAVIFAKHVKHPGFPGRRFVQRTREAVRERLLDLLNSILRRVYG